MEGSTAKPQMFGVSQIHGPPSDGGSRALRRSRGLDACRPVECPEPAQLPTWWVDVFVMTLAARNLETHRENDVDRRQPDAGAEFCQSEPG